MLAAIYTNFTFVTACITTFMMTTTSYLECCRVIGAIVSRDSDCYIKVYLIRTVLNSVLKALAFTIGAFIGATLDPERISKVL